MGWIRELGADPSAYSAHSIRRTKASLIYRRTKNLRAVQSEPAGCTSKSTYPS